MYGLYHYDIRFCAIKSRISETRIGELSVHPSPPLVRRAENMTNERKARDTSLRLD